MVLKRTARRRDEKSGGHSPVRSLKGRAGRQCQASELAVTRRTRGYQKDSITCMKRSPTPGNHLFTDGWSMLEDTATSTVRSSSVEDLGRMSGIRANSMSRSCVNERTDWASPWAYPASWWLLWLTSAASSSQPPPARSQPRGRPPWGWRRTTGRCPCRSRGGDRLSWGWLPLPSAPWGGKSQKTRNATTTTLIRIISFIHASIQPQSHTNVSSIQKRLRWTSTVSCKRLQIITSFKNSKPRLLYGLKSHIHCVCVCVFNHQYIKHDDGYQVC